LFVDSDDWIEKNCIQELYQDIQRNNSDVSCCWEKEAHACFPDVRLVIARFGVVLSEDGGVLRQMLHLQRLSGIGVVIGDGQQSFPWISVHDLCRSFDF
ncbi:hypothetical protein NE573_24105, partial [Parabacteroides distasonis]|nr:hypothetical protein [Parabacteroides distasonis]